jgi:hypothetical protein
LAKSVAPSLHAPSIAKKRSGLKMEYFDKKLYRFIDRLLTNMAFYGLMSVFAANAVAKTLYFSLEGNTSNTCEENSYAAPWRSLAQEYDKGCINPGDEIVLLAGVYDAGDPFFFSPKGHRIWVHGTPEKPIIIRSEKSALTNWPVVFLGPLIISSEHIVISGIDFRGSESSLPILAIGKSKNVTLQSNRIHDTANDYSKFRVMTGDCLKIAGGKDPVEEIYVLNNTIYNCAEDAIDINGRESIVIDGNIIYSAALMQIKGGAQNISVTNNSFANMRYGIVGQGMDCSEDVGEYCGNHAQTSLPIAARYQARLVRIEGNRFENIWVGAAVEPSGWRDTEIRNNYFEHANMNNAGIFRLRDTIGSAFYDDIARDFCIANREECSSCKRTNGAPCWLVRTRADKIEIIGNTIKGHQTLVLEYETRALADTDSLCFEKNSINTGSESTQKLDGVTSEFIPSSYSCELMDRSPPETPKDFRVF